MKRVLSTVSRRSFLVGASSVLAVPIVLKPARATAMSETLMINSYGGSFQELLVKTVVNPFTEETGIKVNVVPTPDIAKLKAQEITGNVEIDVFNTTAATAAYGSKQDLWEKLDLSMFDVDDMLTRPTSHFVVTDLYIGGIGWDPKKYGPGKHPADFAEYFDLSKFPGRRTLRNRPEETLEAALLADGVPPKEIYPLDLERAFKALDRIKPGIASWITATPQTTSLLQTGEVDFSYTSSNRVEATNKPGGGTPLAFSFEQNLLGPETLSISKGSPRKETAMKYISYFMRPEVVARLCNASSGLPNSRKAASMLSPETRKWMPDINSPKHLVLDGKYWADNLEEVSRRFKEWVLI